MGRLIGVTLLTALAGLVWSCTGPKPTGNFDATPPRAVPEVETLPPSAEIPEEETAAVLGVRTESADAGPAPPPMTGRVRGRIYYEGFDVAGQFDAPDLPGEPRSSVRPRGLPGAVVIVLAEPRDHQLVGKNVRIVGTDPCRFRPRITVVQKGAPLLLTNPGPTAHFVAMETTINRPFAGPLSARESKEVVLEDPEAVSCVCTTHRGRPGWIIAAGSPFYAVTDAAGNFRIGGIPPGEHPVRIWHETLVEQLGEVRIEPGGEVEFTYVMSQP